MSKLKPVRSIQIKKGESNWNGRFYLETIPPYDAFKDPNCIFII